MRFSKLQSNQSGTTLLETMIYMLIVGFVLAGVLVSVYQIMGTSDQLYTKNNVEQEASFIISKIDWALNDVSAINLPSIPNTSGAVLSVNKNSYSSNPIRFALSGDDITIKEGSGTAVNLNSDRVTVSTVSFDFIQQTGTLTVNSIKVHFYVNGKYYEALRVIR